MNKYILCAIISLTVSNYMFSADRNPEIIKNASYGVCDCEKTSVWGMIHAFGGLCRNSKVTYYTYNGEPIKTITSQQTPIDCYTLDPSAPKPQPTAYEVKFWPTIQMGLITKGAPGDFILFKDKHGNTITRYRFNKKTQKVTVIYCTDHCSNPRCTLLKTKEYQEFR